MAADHTIPDPPAPRMFDYPTGARPHPRPDPSPQAPPAQPTRRIGRADFTVLAWHLAQVAIANRNHRRSPRVRLGLAQAVSAVADACQQIDPTFDRRAFIVACDVPEAL